MYESVKRSSQIGNERRIIIDEVNPTQLFVSGHDSYQKAYRVNFDFQGPIAMFPTQGEMWTIKQYNNEWRLDRRAEVNNEKTSLASMAPGDRRIEAQNNLYLNGESVLINGDDLLAIIADLQTRLTALEHQSNLLLENQS